MQVVVPCPADGWTFGLQIIIAVFAVSSSCFTAYLAFRLSEAKLDREYKFLALQLQLGESRTTVLKAINGGLNPNEPHS